MDNAVRRFGDAKQRLSLQWSSRFTNCGSQSNDSLSIVLYWKIFCHWEKIIGVVKNYQGSNIR